MDFPLEGIWNREMAMGLFSLYVVIVSLLRIMAEREFFRLTVMKRLWGRTRGLVLHFVTNVALPLVLGIVFLTQGVSLSAGQGDSAGGFSGAFPFQIDWRSAETGRTPLSPESMMLPWQFSAESAESPWSCPPPP